MNITYYLRSKPNPAQIKQLHYWLDKYIFGEISKVTLDNELSASLCQICIGKQFDGWQFLWNYAKGKYYSPNINSILEWLTTYTTKLNWIIVDNFNNHYSLEEFITAIQSSMYDGYNQFTYCKKPSTKKDDAFCAFTTSDDAMEFIMNKLRFSKVEDYGELQDKCLCE